MAERGCEGFSAVWWKLYGKEDVSGLRAVFFVPIGLVCKMGCKMVCRGGMIMVKYTVNKHSTMFLWAVRRIFI